MKALISTDQPIESGYYVVQVCKKEFEVAPQLFWKDCDDIVAAYRYWYNTTTEEFSIVLPPLPPEPIDGSEPNVIG